MERTLHVVLEGLGESGCPPWTLIRFFRQLHVLDERYRSGPCLLMALSAACSPSARALFAFAAYIQITSNLYFMAEGSALLSNVPAAIFLKIWNVSRNATLSIS